MMKKTTFFVLIILFSQIGFAQMQPKFEFRAAWVASVENIDWPSSKLLSTEEQKASFIQIVNKHKENGMNALIVQIRPAADAFYPSKLEPWSEYLTGKQGKAPSPYYDPLQFMIDETHKRGMEFHAWLNPYRAVFNMATSSIAHNHITKTHPHWFLVYGGKKYFNPALPEVRNYVNNVVKDIVERYDIDAIHMDDYFYPYRIAGKEFPDEKDYHRFGNGLSKDEWRRSNCDSIIYQLYQTITAVNGRVKFGISPFGVWRNASKDPIGSNTKAGQTNYDDLYADILLWLKKGWIDYVIPQLYWERGHKLCDYDTLLQWWNQHTYGRHLYIGHGIYRANTSEGWRKKEELPKQIEALRQYTTTQGSAYFSSKSFDTNPNGWNDSLRMNYYALPAIVPPMPWIDSVAAEKPLIKAITKTEFELSYQGEERIKGFALFAVAKQLKPIFSNASLVQIVTANQKAVISTKHALKTADNFWYAATIDENNNVSEWVKIPD